MQRRLYPIFAVIMLAAIILSACATPTPAVQVVENTVQVPVTQVVKETSVVNVTTVVKETQQVVITATSPVKATALPAGSVKINGAGASFPAPIYTEWTYAYQYVDPSVIINYQGSGSGAGKKAIVDGTVDFAGSDSFLSDAEYTSGKDLQMYPALAGAVVMIYNVSFKMPKVGDKTPTPAPLPAMILDGKTIVGIYNGTINKWNDPTIIALNPDIKDFLPDAKITAVHRSDGSGTTEMFTKALTSFSPDWKAGGAQSVEWPVDKAGNGLGGKGNPGVASTVQNTPNSIGYVELSYATANSIAYTKMVNKAGKTVSANAASLSSAMADFSDKFSDKLTNTIVDGPGEGSWPISGYTYLILHTTRMTDCTKAQKLLEYIKWTLTDAGAAQRASKLGYAVLPDAVQKTVLAKLAAVTCSGKPVLK
jgi:phosphate transport system substrate-binding protein